MQGDRPQYEELHWNTCVQNWLSTNRPSFAAADPMVQVDSLQVSSVHVLWTNLCADTYNIYSRVTTTSHRLSRSLQQLTKLILSLRSSTVQRATRKIITGYLRNRSKHTAHWFKKNMRLIRWDLMALCRTISTHRLHCHGRMDGLIRDRTTDTQCNNTKYNKLKKNTSPWLGYIIHLIDVSPNGPF